MAEHETLPVSGAVHNSVVVDEAVESLHYGRILIDIFDSAIVMKTDDGAVRASGSTDRRLARGWRLMKDAGQVTCAGRRASGIART